MIDFKRLFGLPDEQAYRVALAVQMRCGLVSAEDARGMAATHRLSNTAAVRVAGAVTTALASALSLADFESGRVTDVRTAASNLGVRSAVVEDAIGLAACAAFVKWADSVVASGECGLVRQQEMREIGHRLGLLEADQDRNYMDRVKPAVEEIWGRALADDFLSPDAEAAARHATAKLYVTANIAGALATRVAHAKMSWAIANEPLPTIDPSFTLQRAEVAHFETFASAFQAATRTKAISYAGPALRVRIAKGLYYRRGRYNIHRTTEDYAKLLGYGSLVVTNKRLLFISEKGASSVRLDRIVHIEAFTDAVLVMRDSGKPTTYRFDATAEWFCPTLARAVHDATSPLTA